MFPSQAFNRVITAEQALPFLTHSIPGIPFQFKHRSSDFVVEEIPAYEPSGAGDHVYLWVEKSEIGTHQMIRELKKYFKVPKVNMGYAGLKDARGITRQWVSVQGISLEHARSFNKENIRVLKVCLHKNKLKIGHLRGNFFKMCLRNFPEDRYDDFQAVLAILEAKGVPNYFGPQRFGMRGDSWKIGEALLKKDEVRAAQLIAGDPLDTDEGEVLRARKAFADGRYLEASNLWPRIFSECRQLCRAMDRFGGDVRKALYSLDEKLLWFYLSSFQSKIFNQVLADRLESIDQVRAGDLAMKHENGAVFKVEDLDEESARTQSFEISATGPLPGYRMMVAGGQVAEEELKCFDVFGIQLQDFKLSGKLALKGERRALRFKISDLSAELIHRESASDVKLAFSLPSGCYASSVIREIGKEQFKWVSRD